MRPPAALEHHRLAGPSAAHHRPPPPSAAPPLRPPPPRRRRGAPPARRRPPPPAAAAAAPAGAVGATPPREGVDWDSLGFGLAAAGDFMYVATCEAGPDGAPGEWRAQGLRPYGPLELYPSAQALNYGQAVFEGMKAQRSAAGRVVLFRPDANSARLAAGAARLSMAVPPAELFLEAVRATVAANADLVPPLGRGSLYLRPLLVGSGPILGLGPAPAYTLVVYAAAVGAYFKGGQLAPIDLLVEERFHRAAPGGMGGTKAAGNYSPVLVTQLAAKAAGYADVVYLDAKTDTLLEEVSSCNLFVVEGRRIRTPALRGTILPGVTRASVIELARARGYEVVECDVTVDEALKADEVFTTGTAVVLSPVGSITRGDVRRQYGQRGEPTPVALELYGALTALQQERAPDPFGWVVPVE